MFDKLILIDCRIGWQHGTPNLGIVAIKNALEQNNFTNYEIVTQNEILKTTRQEYIDNLSKKLKDITQKSEKPFFALSADTEQYKIFTVTSEVIRKIFPESKIIAGGPHFRKQKLISQNGTVFRDSIDIALQENLADAIVDGHAEPFIKLLLCHEGDISSMDENGFYTIKDGKIYGKGKGKFPSTLVPYSIGNGDLRILLKEGCLNNCDFCAADKGNFYFDYSSLDKALQEDFSIINLVDLNPFEPRNIQFIDEVLTTVDPKRKYPKTAFLDPGLLTDKDHRKIIIDVIKKHKFISFFLGRDCISQPAAEFIGSRYKGKIRVQDELDLEYEGIQKFMEEISGASEFERMIISHILTPIDTEETAIRLLNEQKEIHQRKGRLNITHRLNIACPFPGTRLKSKKLDFILHPENFSLHTVKTSDWAYDLPGANFLDLIAGFKRHTSFSNIEDYHLLKIAIGGCFGASKHENNESPEQLRYGNIERMY